MTAGDLEPRIQRMLTMLNGGQVLEAIEIFYATDARVYENDFLFAESREEIVERQTAFVASCNRIEGDLKAIHMDLGRGISVFYNKSRYSHREFGEGTIDGVHVHYWHDGEIARENYFTGDKREEALAFWQLVGRTQTL